MQTGTWFVVSMITGLAAVSMAAQQPGGQRGGAPAAPAAPAMTLTVEGFPDGGDVPVKFSQAVTVLVAQLQVDPSPA